MNRKLSSLMLGLVAVNAFGLQTAPARPKLVVGIVVDQLRTDYVDHLRELFSDKGFKRLVDKGVYLKDVDFKAPVADPAAATALIYTGTYPAINGIDQAKVFEPATGTYRSVMADEGAMGNFTSDAFSPRAIRVSTLADEISADGAGLGQVFSIAPDSEQALAMTGHAGTSAFWLDGNTGKWSSTTYFKETPKTISRQNILNPLTQRLDTLKWTPLLPLEQYRGLPAQKKYFPFKYHFPKADREAYNRYKESPLVNDEITDLAIGYLDEYRLGSRGDVIDMLNVGFTARPWSHTADGDSRLELEDTYLRLDRQIGRLLDAIDAGAGLDNTLVFLTSTGYYNDQSGYEPSFRIPSGDFSLKRASSLLNAFLSARFGNAQYIKGMDGGRIFLDQSTLEQKQIDYGEAARAARDFLNRMAGVAEVRTYREILASASPETEAMRLGINPSNAADLYIKFTPGWNVVDDLRFPVSSHPVRDVALNTPAIIMAPALKAEQVSGRVEAASLAPTLAGLLRIRPPNGASTRPLILSPLDK